MPLDDWFFFQERKKCKTRRRKIREFELVEPLKRICMFLTIITRGHIFFPARFMSLLKAFSFPPIFVSLFFLLLFLFPFLIRNLYFPPGRNYFLFLVLVFILVLFILGGNLPSLSSYSLFWYLIQDWKTKRSYNVLDLAVTFRHSKKSVTDQLTNRLTNQINGGWVVVLLVHPMRHMPV